MSSRSSRHVFISCGEASGDRYGAALTAALSSMDPDLRISALGGAGLEQAGAEIIADSAELAVMGFSEVISALPTLLRVKNRIGRHLVEQKVDLVVPIDFPGFNGKLASSARRTGIPVFWLIAPQVWAWGSWRIPGLRRKIDRLGTILPFETDFFTQRGFEVFPMGHPLMEDYGRDFPFEENLAARESRLSKRDAPLTIAILPGSRRQELKHLLPILKVTTQAVLGHLGDRNVRFVVSVAPGIDPVTISSVFESGVEITDRILPRLLNDADLALVCSGTASLEAALAGVPHELVYRTGALNGFLGRHLVRTNHIGLSNIILGQQMVREHLQDNASPLPLARNLLRWLSRPAEREGFYNHVRRVRQLCGRQGVWERTARAVLDMIPAEAGAQAETASGNGA
ncbi:MAG: lipid-A-disaccharide synthase [Candidatus Krumholzibacteriota bacterium]